MVEIAADSSVTVAVVVPAYRIRDQIVDVVSRIGPEVDLIYVVDDACPEHSGEHLVPVWRLPRQGRAGRT